MHKPRSPRDRLGKETAGYVLRVAIRRGEVLPAQGQQCSDCGKPATHYDHRDYNQPLAVEPVCHGCNLRRGPAIPIDGALEATVAAGHVPYTLRVRTAQLLSALGLSAALLDAMPKRLSIDHWREVLGHIQAQRAQA